MRGSSGRRRRAAGVGAGLSLAAAAWAANGPVLAAPASVAWSTYLRAGPGQTYAALAELEHDTRVEVAGCDADWCHVSSAHAQGYVDRQALDLPRTLAPVPPANGDCVVAGQADNRGPIPTRFCSAHAPGG